MHRFVSCTVIYSGVFGDINRKALATGLCYFLKEPITPNDLQYLWQHVYHSRPCSPTNTQNADFHAKGFQNTQMKQVHIYIYIYIVKRVISITLHTIFNSSG